MSFDGDFSVNVVLKGNMGEIKGLREIVEFRNSIDGASSHTVLGQTESQGKGLCLNPSKSFSRLLFSDEN